MENELFGDSIYDINYRKNVQQRKPKNLPKNEDVQKLLQECKNIMNDIDMLDVVSKQFVAVRAAAATYLTIFNARRGGEPVRLTLTQWEEALRGEWEEHVTFEEDEDVTLLVTFQTGKGADHLVPVMFPTETHSAMRYYCFNILLSIFFVSKRREGILYVRI